ncbi:hypothetical protein JCM11251_005254 [Rhodosporidiobolus azoricus]
MLSRGTRRVRRVAERLTRPIATTPAPYKPLQVSPPSPSAPPPAPLSAARQQARHRIDEVDRLSASPPVSPFLTDSFGRKHDYLRISLTEKCNLRCTYCMPEQGVPLLPRDDLLTTDEIERVARLFVQNGVSKIRLTGGEPTVRKDLVDVVSRLSRLPLTSLGMTSNGIALKRKLPSLVTAGLTHLNLSLDTLDEFKYELMTRRRGFHAVMEALEVAKGLKGKGLRTKINVVVIRGLNDMEVADFVELTRESDITVRFIEYMPFEDNRWSTTKLVPSHTLLSSLRSHFSPSHGEPEKLSDSPSDTTRAYRVPGFKGSFGFISSMTDHFCGGCSRLRIGADGRVKVCLFGPPVLSLRPLLRSSPASPISDLALMQQIGSAVWGKKFAHDGLGAPLATLAQASPLLRAPPLFLTRRTSPTSIRVPLHLLPPYHPSSPISMGARTYSTLSSRREIAPSTHQSQDDDPPSNYPSATASSPSPSPSMQASSPSTLTHIDPRTGKASMVSVSAKPSTLRSATAVGYIELNKRAWDLIDLGGETENSTGATMKTKKGDVLSIAQLAGLMGAKHTSLLIPLCHPLSLSHISVSLSPVPSTLSLRIEATAECVGPTGVEMEALTAVTTAGLVVWDMCKAVAGEEMELGGVKVIRKSGGRSGDWVREE